MDAVGQAFQPDVRLESQGFEGVKLGAFQGFLGISDDEGMPLADEFFRKTSKNLSFWHLQSPGWKA